MFIRYLYLSLRHFRRHSVRLQKAAEFFLCISFTAFLTHPAITVPGHHRFKGTECIVSFIVNVKIQRDQKKNDDQCQRNYKRSLHGDTCRCLLPSFLIPAYHSVFDSVFIFDSSQTIILPIHPSKRNGINGSESPFRTFFRIRRTALHPAHVSIPPVRIRTISHTPVHTPAAITTHPSP